MSIQLPVRAQMYFWGDDLGKLNWVDHKNYIVQTLLEKGDLEAVKWLFGNIDRTELKGLLPVLKLQPKSRNFWQIYLS